MFALLGGATAGRLEDGRAAYQRGDYGVAMRLLRSSGANNRADAQRDIGLMYAQGQGVQQDFAQALIWFRKAADQGEAVALFNLGLAYDKGDGAPHDSAQAAVWYRKAADKGNVAAQINLGSLYTSGEGVPKNYILAYMWADLAASRAQDDETREVANRNRDNLVRGMSAEQIAEARRMARAWKPTN